MCFRPSFGPRKRKQLWAAVLQGMGFIFWESISLTSLLFLIADLLSSFGGAGRSCRSSLARGASRSVATELVLPSAWNRGGGSSLRAGSQQRIGKSCLCLHLFPLHSSIREWSSADTPPERLGFRECLQFFFLSELGARALGMLHIEMRLARRTSLGTSSSARSENWT